MVNGYFLVIQLPVQFKVHNEGQYGFAVELVNGAGSTTGQPSNGTKPPFVTIVDFSPPTVLL